MILSTLLLVLIPAQEPSDALQRAFLADEVEVRHDAARTLAIGDERSEAWLLREVRKGTEERQRALLLAAALMGTPETFAELEHAARKGRKPDPMRAFALLLYGSLHPDACNDVERDWERGASEFERSCFLAGLLSRPQRMLVEPLPSFIRKRKEEGPLAFLRLAEALVSSGFPDGEAASDVAASLILSVDPSREALDLAAGLWRGEYPPLWEASRRHGPPRTLEKLRSQTLVGDRIGAALSLYEVASSDRQVLFEHFAPRAIGEAESRWLWGAAGDLELELPNPKEGETLRACHVVGLLRLYRQDRNRGMQSAKRYLNLGRRAFEKGGTLEQRWPAVLLLALGGESQDLASLQQAFADAEPVWTFRFAPVWKFAQRRLGSASLADHWLDLWTRDLGSGWQGYMDREGPRWVGYLLAGGTIAAELEDRLSERYEKLESVSRDYAIDHLAYRDLVGYLLGGDYRWME